MLKAIFFDLDGTLLPMDEKKFVDVYIPLLYEKVKHLGYTKDDLVKALFSGLKKMYGNVGPKTNGEVFWDNFAMIFDKDKLKDKPVFDDFYANEFYEAKSACKDNPLARIIIDYIHQKKEIKYCVLSTNPIFPRVGTLTRLKMINLKEEDFDYVSFYENSFCSKPNPLYFQNLLEKFSLKPEEVIVFGNNDYEDFLCAKKAGIDCYLIRGTVILHPEMKIDCPFINMDEVIPTIEKEITLRKNQL